MKPGLDTFDGSLKMPRAAASAVLGSAETFYLHRAVEDVVLHFWRQVCGKKCPLTPVAVTRDTQA
jgi:hypothetical protein